MIDSRVLSIFRTNKIPTTHISQNHLDALHAALNNFCELNETYEWRYINTNNRRIKGDKAITYINKHEPQTLQYIVESKLYDSELLISISNGITLNLRNASYLLYGLYALINDTLDSVKVPAYVVYLRRYWLLNIFLAGWLIPVLIFLMFSSAEGAKLWFIIFPIVVIQLTGMLLNDKDSFIEKLEWGDVVLSTKIQYKIYRSKVGSPILTLLSSTKTMVSIAASLATIISFLLYLAQS